MTDTWRRHPPQPQITNRYTGPDRHTDFPRATGGQHSTDHMVHARIHWQTHDGTRYAEWTWGFATAWTENAIEVHLWRHGEHWAWLPRADVEPCTCTTLHEPRYWPAWPFAAYGSRKG